jgi:hypothetical protein
VKAPYSQRLVRLVLAADHRTQIGRELHRAEALHIGLFLGRRLAVLEPEPDVGGKDLAALCIDGRRHRPRDRIHAGDGSGAEQDAEDEDVEAAQASAHFAERKAKGQRQVAEENPGAAHVRAPYR